MVFLRVSARPDLVGIRVGTLDDPSWFRPEADIFVKSAQPWDHMNPDLPKHDTYPPRQGLRTATLSAPLSPSCRRQLSTHGRQWGLASPPRVLRDAPFGRSSA